MNDFTPFIKAVGRGEKLKRDLTYDEAYEAMRMMLAGEATEAQMGAFLIAQRVKGEGVPEVQAFTDAIRSEAVRPIAPRLDTLLDLATPYDGKAKTAQLAPAVALTLRAAGVPVVLHGAVDIPTKAGVTVAHVLRQLGIATDVPPAVVETMLESVGIGYVDARHFAPAYDALTALRQQFGLRTVFNTVEKWLNPANAPWQVSGFFHANYIERVRSVQTGRERSFIVQGEEGSIEMAAGRRTRLFGIASADDITLAPATVGLPTREKILLAADADQHVALNQAVIAGHAGSAADQVAFTAGTILYLFGQAASVVVGYERAHALLQAQKVASILQEAQRFTLALRGHASR